MKSITIIAILVSLSLGGFAQNKHEFSVYGGGGLSTLNYKVSVGEQQNGFGGQFGLGYTFFFSPKWGLGTGVEMAFYNARFSMDNFSNRYTTTDMDGNSFEFRSTLTNYEEKQGAMLLQIPLMLHFQTGNTHRFYAALGGKIGIPLSGIYESTNDGLKNSGYYAHEDYEYTTQEFMGFGTFKGKDVTGDLDFKTAFFVSAEAGMKWKLAGKWSLYTGLYVDYGLNNIYQTQDPAPQFVAYNSENPQDFTVNSILASQYMQNGISQTFTDKINPLAAGVKIALSLGCGQHKEKTAAQTEPVVNNTENQAQREAEEQARKAAAEKAEADRLAQEQEAQRLAAEKARREEQAKQKQRALQIQQEIQQPIENYALSQVELTAAQKQELDAKIVLLQQNPEIAVYIYGHTCDLSGDAVNEKVGLRRAEKAKEYLISKGIAESRILGIASKRDTEPMVPNNSEENRKKNRRVEIVIQK